MASYKPIPSFDECAQTAFWAKVDRASNLWPGCWIWAGKRTPSGYGCFREYRAHRIAYVLQRGSIPDDLSLDHVCRNRLCVNPDHLEIVTNKINILRGVSPTAINARRTHCKNGHAFTPQNTRKTGNGRRLCRICRQAYVKAHGYFR